jgi:hypothetical protein
MTVDEQVIAEAAETARRYLDGALLAPLSEFGLLLKDKISYWRYKNQVNTILRAKAFLDAKGLDPAEIQDCIDPEIVVPLIETASTTASEPLPDLFAGLLAASLQDDHTNVVHKSYIQVLGNISSIDARILIAIKDMVDREIATGRTVKKGDSVVPVTHRELGITVDSAKQALGISTKRAILSFENVWRLGICDRGSNALDHLNRVDRVYLTRYGIAFLHACTKDIQNTAHPA